MSALNDLNTSTGHNNFSGVSKPLVIVFIITLVLTLGILAFFGYSLLNENAQDLSNNQIPIVNFSSQSYEEFSKEYSKRKWDYTSMTITAQVTQIDKENDKLFSFFTWPPQIAGISKWVKIDCAPDDFNIIIISNKVSNPTKIEKEIFFKMLIDGTEQSFTGFCQNEACEVIDKGCSFLRVIES